jgi:23S rRNA (pseudouridine1915-N3)-methyltransferase
MKFKVFAVGDKLEKFYLETIKEYEKRLSRYCDIKLIHIKKEEQLQKKVSENSFVIVVATTGQSVSSEELATNIDNWASTGISDVSIIIGTSDIPHNVSLTLSQMEMNFELKVAILFEQIYRAYRIVNNHPYHK